MTTPLSDDPVKVFYQKLQEWNTRPPPEHELVPKFLEGFADVLTYILQLQASHAAMVALEASSRKVIEAQRQVITAKDQVIASLGRLPPPPRFVRGTPPQGPLPAPERDTGLWPLSETGSNGLQVHPH